jgi:A/G-specific adenine glycosylase
MPRRANATSTRRRSRPKPITADGRASGEGTPAIQPDASDPIDADLGRDLTRWFSARARDLPWRRPLVDDPNSPPRPDRIRPRRDPYATLVSELMLQQTQVSRVIEKFQAFLAEFPTVRHLADADEHRVLALWSGLGYYRRARLLHAAARKIVDDFDAVIPADIDQLRSIPGIGDYTAGAIASIALDRPVPLVDGNVARVLFRLHGRDAAQSDPRDMAWAWKRAARLVDAATSAVGTPALHAGDLNEALMELGATVCTPAAARCMFCPVRDRCDAYSKGLVDRIPRPKKAPAKRAILCLCLLITDRRGRLLLERRSDDGMWAGMWQTPTVEINALAPARPVRDRQSAGVQPIPPAAARHAKSAISAESVRQAFALDASTPLEPVDDFPHQTTHRDVRFAVWRVPPDRAAAVAKSLASRAVRWIAAKDAADLALSNPQRRIILGRSAD